MGHTGSEVRLLATAIPIIQLYVGPFPFAFLTQQIDGLIQVICDSRFTQRTICESLTDLLVGASGGQIPLVSSILLVVGCLADILHRERRCWCWR